MSRINRNNLKDKIITVGLLTFFILFYGSCLYFSKQADLIITYMISIPASLATVGAINLLYNKIRTNEWIGFYKDIKNPGFQLSFLKHWLKSVEGEENE